jgi:hypothetical protein
MVHTFSFAFDPRYTVLLRGWGVSPQRASLTVDESELRVRFGLLTLTTPRSNIREATVTGPHKPRKALGIRMSLSDRGLTFGTSVERTTCISFVERVRAEPFDIAGHPALSVSVDDPDRLAELLNAG